MSNGRTSARQGLVVAQSESVPPGSQAVSTHELGRGTQASSSPPNHRSGYCAVHVDTPGSQAISTPGSQAVSTPGSQSVSTPGSQAVSTPGSQAVSALGSQAISAPGSQAVNTQAHRPSVPQAHRPSVPLAHRLSVTLEPVSSDLVGPHTIERADGTRPPVRADLSDNHQASPAPRAGPRTSVSRLHLLYHQNCRASPHLPK